MRRAPKCRRSPSSCTSNSQDSLTDASSARRRTCGYFCPKLSDAKFSFGLYFRSCPRRCAPACRRFSRCTLESLVSRISSASLSFALADAYNQHPNPLLLLFIALRLFPCVLSLFFYFSLFFLQSEYSFRVGGRSTTPFYAVCCTTRVKRTPVDICRKGVESASGRRLGRARRCDIES